MLKVIFGNEYFDTHGTERQTEDASTMVDASDESDEEENYMDTPFLACRLHTISRALPKRNLYPSVPDE